MEKEKPYAKMSKTSYTSRNGEKRRTSFRLHEKTFQNLAKMAEDQGVTMTNILENLINYHYSKKDLDLVAKYINS